MDTMNEFPIKTHQHFHVWHVFMCFCNITFQSLFICLSFKSQPFLTLVGWRNEISDAEWSSILLHVFSQVSWELINGMVILRDHSFMACEWFQTTSITVDVFVRARWKNDQRVLSEHLMLWAPCHPNIPFLDGQNDQPEKTNGLVKQEWPIHVPNRYIYIIIYVYIYIYIYTYTCDTCM